jgi:hypothetical protein
MVILRRLVESTVWHFECTCSRWPARGYVQASQPKEGIVCKECLALSNHELQENRKANSKKQQG